MSLMIDLSTALPLSHTLGRAVVRALYTELILYPKPGLVSRVDSGAHDDMDATTFYKSLFALRHCFVQIAASGAHGAPFATVQAVGLAAERRMLWATGGVNTHRGAIFLLGWLTAAAGWRRWRGLPLDPAGLIETILSQWGQGIAAAGAVASPSHGRAAVGRFGVRGAREELLAGLPVLLEAVVPTLLARGPTNQTAQVQALFMAMATLQDTTLLHRGGLVGLERVQNAAQTFLDAGGVDHPGWRDKAVALHRLFITHRLSPGGSADMVAAGCFVAGLQA